MTRSIHLDRIWLNITAVKKVILGSLIIIEVWSLPALCINNLLLLDYLPHKVQIVNVIQGQNLFIRIVHFSLIDFVADGLLLELKLIGASSLRV